MVIVVNNKESTAAKLVVTKPAKQDKTPRTYGTGRRKNAVARVWLSVGTGVVTINKKPMDKYFPREALVQTIMQPLHLTQNAGLYDIFCTVTGGGCSGQAGAVLHGLARALDDLVPELHQKLRSGGFLTRDSRVVERKKYGKHKARKGTQFSKR